MNKKSIATVILAATVVAGTLAFAQQPSAPKPVADPRIDKILEQNELILKNQQEMLKQLDEIKTVVGGLKRRLT